MHVQYYKTSGLLLQNTRNNTLEQVYIESCQENVQRLKKASSVAMAGCLTRSFANFKYA